MASMRYLSAKDVQTAGLTMTEVVEAVEQALRLKGEGKVEMPPKPGIHTQPDAFIHAMPAYLPDMRSAGIKWVSGYPGNMKRGLPYITGLLILNDPDTGIPLAVMDCTWITAKRTGAASAVAARYLARRDSHSLAILGCGVQGRSHLEALKCVLPGLAEVRAFDVVPEAQQRFLQWAESTFGVVASGARDPQDAVDGADIVVTAGPILKRPQAVIRWTWIKPGAFISPVDFDSYVRPEVFRKANMFYTDDLGQQAYYKKIGYFRGVPPPTADLGDLLTGRAPGRRDDAEVTLSCNLGLALEDMAVAVRLLARAEAANLGTMLEL